MELTDRDRKNIGLMRELGILRDIEGHKLDQRNGVILITCADGDRFFDLFTHEARIVADQCTDRRVHVFGWNGGAIRLAGRRPMKRAKRPLTNGLVNPFEEVAAARKMKGIDTVALYAHAPCGAAYAHRFDVVAVIDALMAAKKNLKEENNGVKVACFFHVHHGKDRDRTYFVSRLDWETNRSQLSE